MKDANGTAHSFNWGGIQHPQLLPSVSAFGTLRLRPLGLFRSTNASTGRQIEVAHGQELSVAISVPPLPRKNPPERGGGERGQKVFRSVLSRRKRAMMTTTDPPPSSSASPEEWECYRNQEVLRQCLFRLKWGNAQLAQFIAEQFEGRQFYQLLPNEVTLLIYRLQVQLMDEPPE